MGGPGSGPARDPVSVGYDNYVRKALLSAIRARHAGRKGATVFVRSHASEFRHLDAGGRTVHERAFTRSVYWQSFRQPLKQGLAPEWAPSLEWLAIENRGGRYGRSVRIRMWTKKEGQRKARTSRLTRDQRWSSPGPDNPARSTADNRMGPDGRGPVVPRL